jgi:aspartate aminotransferase
MTPALDLELESLLALQEHYDQYRKEWVLHAGRKLCDLAYANPTEAPDPQVIRAISNALRRGRHLDLQYTPYGGSTITRRLVAQRLSATHDQAFRWRDVIMTPGAMAALNIAFRFLRSGDGPHEVIVPTPCWMDYPLYLVNLGLRPVFVPLDRKTLRLDVERIAGALTPGTRAIVLSQPANPSGVLYSDDELSALAEVLRSSGQRLGIEPWIVSDESHRDIVFEPWSFVSPLKHYSATLIVYSFGKGLFIQGQRIGYVAVSPKLSTREYVITGLERLCRAMGFCTPTALMQLAVRDLLEVKPDLERIAARRKRVLRALASYGYEIPASQATYFVYPRSPIRDDQQFVRGLAERGVLVLPATLFHHSGHVRLSLTASDEMIERALPEFRRAITLRRAS